MSDQIGHLPLQDIGLNNIPAVPYLLTFSEPLGTVLRLGLRALETRPAKGFVRHLHLGTRQRPHLSFLLRERAVQPVAWRRWRIERVLLGGAEPCSTG